MSDNIIHLNEAALKGEFKNLVRNSAEKTLNELLNHEADRLVNAQRNERNTDRKGYRSGHYDRNFTTTSGNVTLHVPKLKGITFETVIIERYRRRETSIEEALIEMIVSNIFRKILFPLGGRQLPDQRLRLCLAGTVTGWSRHGLGGGLCAGCPG